jgi:hypothetical protein
MIEASAHVANVLPVPVDEGLPVDQHSTTLPPLPLAGIVLILAMGTTPVKVATGRRGLSVKVLIRRPVPTPDDRARYRKMVIPTKHLTFRHQRQRRVTRDDTRRIPDPLPLHWIFSFSTYLPRKSWRSSYTSRLTTHRAVPSHLSI